MTFRSTSIAPNKLALASCQSRDVSEGTVVLVHADIEDGDDLELLDARQGAAHGRRGLWRDRLEGRPDAQAHGLRHLDADEGGVLAFEIIQRAVDDAVGDESAPLDIVLAEAAHIGAGASSVGGDEDLPVDHRRYALHAGQAFQLFRQFLEVR
jgi:hypothetical protein